MLSSQKRLDSEQGRDYTKCTKSGGQDPPLLVPPVQKRAKKANMARMNDPRETACGGAEGEGENSQAKGSDQDGTSESARHRRCTPKGQVPEWARISQVTTEAERPKGPFCLFFCAETGASRRKGASNPYRPSATSPRGGSMSEAGDEGESLPPAARGRKNCPDGSSPSPVSCADILPRWGRNRRTLSSKRKTENSKLISYGGRT